MQSMLEEHGYRMSYERVRRLMRKADITPIYPRRILTQRCTSPYIYPYLLRGMTVERVNQIWQIDITYIPMKNGFMYMTAIIDVYSRYIVGWGLSNTLGAGESLKVLEQAVQTHGKPDILNSDQGSQFTCYEYVNYLKNKEIKISMDGKGRCVDNIFIERFWRTLKYQYVYLNPKDNGLDLFIGIKNWIERYHNRRHQGIAMNKPKLIYNNAA